MKRNSRHKRQHPSTGSPRVSSRCSRATRTLGSEELRTLTRTELVALVLELQSRKASRDSAADPIDAAAADDAEQTAEPSADARAKTVALVIENSIRSGQTIEFPDGDVTVIGSVSSGAEIIAGGSIHVYGTWRGRAIAGTSGDQTARIFCQDLDAELLSIDGRYRVADNFDPKLRGRPVQARLDGLRMALVPLDYPASPAADSVAEEWGSTDKLRRATDRVRQLISIGVPRTSRMAEVATS
jgi:septum site-determining protein MinC